MAKELICQACIGALFYPRQEPEGRKYSRLHDYAGYLRMKVSEPIRGSSGKSRPITPHRYFPLLFVPSAWERGKKKGGIHFNTEQAFVARREEFAGGSEQKKEWELFSLDSLNIPAREKEKLETLYVKLEQSLEKIVDRLFPLGKDSVSRRIFLGSYPDQLKEGVDLPQAYGAAMTNDLRLSLYQEELPSYDGGRVKNKTLPPRKVKEYLWYRP